MRGKPEGKILQKGTKVTKGGPPKGTGTGGQRRGVGGEEPIGMGVLQVLSKRLLANRDEG